MLYFAPFFVILSILSPISDAHFIPNYHKHSKYHRNHQKLPQRQQFFTNGPIPYHFFAPQLLETPKIDIRHSVHGDSRREFGHESLSVHQCDFTPNDFEEESPARRSVVCTWDQELIVRRHYRRGFWCIGYLGRDSAVLTLKFDRNYRMGYSPGGIDVQNTNELEETFYLDPDQLTTIVIRGTFNGLPDLEYIEFNNERICDDEESDDISSEMDFPAPKPASNVCGTRQMTHSELISNGAESNPGDWPFHASIFHTSIRNFQYKCGGTIISNTFILTAAHCVLDNGHELIPERVKVHVGRSNLKNFDRNSEEFSVYKILCHEKFNRDTVRHDIALLKLGESISFTRFIQKACLPERDFNIVGGVGTVIGFGRTESGELSTVLREARMKVPTTMDCLESNRDFYGLFLYDGNFCAGKETKKAAACNGDSGGGMYFKVDNVWVVRGIVSVGMRSDKEENCSPDNFVLYTDVYKHIAWIREKI